MWPQQYTWKLTYREELLWTMAPEVSVHGQLAALSWGLWRGIMVEQSLSPHSGEETKERERKRKGPRSQWSTFSNKVLPYTTVYHKGSQIKWHTGDTEERVADDKGNREQSDMSGGPGNKACWIGGARKYPPMGLWECNAAGCRGLPSPIVRELSIV